MRKLFGRWFRRARPDADLEEEMRAHIELDIEDKVGRGVSPADARRWTRLELGSVGSAIESVRDQDWLAAVESCYRDVVLGLREMRRQPVFAVTAVLTLALGIGANVAIFSFLYGLLLRSLPVPAPSEIVALGIKRPTDKGTAGAGIVSARMIPALAKGLSSFGELSLWTLGTVALDDGSGALLKHNAALVSGNGFGLLALRPHLGRFISPFDDIRGGGATGWPAVLDYGFWLDHFGGDPALVGKRLRISGVQVTVIGVAPPAFRGVWPGNRIELYLPLSFTSVIFGRDLLDDPQSFFGGTVLTRLRPGVLLAHAQSDVDHWQSAHLREFIPAKRRNDPFFREARLVVRPARTGLPSYVTQTYSGALYLMQVLVGVVLLLCCVNVCGLMMTKVHRRAREFAVRTALGARVWRLVRQYLTESLVIAVTGSALGAALAWRGCDVLLHFFRDPMMGETMSVHPDSAIFYAAAGLAVAATLLFGTLPAWRAGHADPGELLKSRTSIGGRHRKSFWGRLFVPIQVALSLVLVTVASLLLQSVLKLRAERTGFDVDNITIQNTPFYLLNRPAGQLLELYVKMVDRLNQTSGVRATAAVQTPLTGVEITSRFAAVAPGDHPPEDSHMAFNEVLPGYFHAMGTRIVAGREFAANELRLDVCVLNRAAAAFLFPHEEVLGRYVRSLESREFPAGKTCRVVGIAENAKFSNVRSAPPRTIYFPITEERIRWGMVFMLNAPSKAHAIAAFRKVLAEQAPSVPLSLFATLREQMDAALGSQELITLISNFFGLLALLLSALGLYGLLAATVGQRTGEIGLRMALGADRRTVIWMILREALIMLLAGLVLGGAALFLATRPIISMLHGVSAFDGATLVATGFLLLVVTVAAALIPALRAARIDPNLALREGGI